MPIYDDLRQQIERQRDKDIRSALNAELPRDSERQRRSDSIGRLLKRLHVRGLIIEVSRTRRKRVTDNGRLVMGDTLQTYRRYHETAA